MRPCSRTATTGPPGSRRIVRGAPGRRGGVRNAGTVSPAARVAAPSRRATSANRTVGTRSTRRFNPTGETLISYVRRMRRPAVLRRHDDDREILRLALPGVRRARRRAAVRARRHRDRRPPRHPAARRARRRGRRAHVGVRDLQLPRLRHDRHRRPPDRRRRPNAPRPSTASPASGSRSASASSLDVVGLALGGRGSST